VVSCVLLLDIGAQSQQVLTALDSAGRCDEGSSTQCPMCMSYCNLQARPENLTEAKAEKFCCLAEQTESLAQKLSAWRRRSFRGAF
jgi:hypothetical protein